MGYRHLMSAVLVALTVCMAATAAAAARTKDNEGGGAFTSEELQAAVRSFADSWSSQIVEATVRLARQMATPQARNQANRFGYYTISGAIDIAAGPHPGAALLDMLVLVTLSRMVWKSTGCHRCMASRPRVCSQRCRNSKRISGHSPPGC